MSDFSINGIKNSGSINELKPGVSIKEAFEKGKNDKIDQVYFEADGKNYVFQGEGLNLNGLNQGSASSNMIIIGGKKVEATVAGSEPETEITINGKTIKAKIIAVDDEANTKGESFKNGISSVAGQMGISFGGVTTTIGVVGSITNALCKGSVNYGRTAFEPMPAGKTIIVGLAVTALSAGVAGLYGVYKDSNKIANPEQLKPLLGKQVTF